MFMYGRFWATAKCIPLPKPHQSIFAVRHSSTTNFSDEKLRQIIETSKVGIARREQENKTKTGHTPAPLEEPKKSTYKMPPSTDKLESNLSSNSISTNDANEGKKQVNAMAQALQARLGELRGTLSVVSKALNDLTGYSAIEKLKTLVIDFEEELRQAKKNLKAAKLEYTEAIQNRSDMQKEINELLTRKHNWSSGDVERFTELYKNDHINQQQEEQAERKLEAAEQNVDTVQNLLTQLILTRYHEEQMWSDKIRQVLTWGTWLLTGVNVLLFIVAAFFVEPWKRRRLVDAFQKEMQVKVDAFSEDIKNLSGQIAAATEAKDEITSVETPPLLEKADFFQLNFSSIRTWLDAKRWFRATASALQNPQVGTYMMDKTEFWTFTAVFVAVGCTLGSALSYAFLSYK